MTVTEAAEGVVLVDTSDLDFDASVEAVLDVVAAETAECARALGGGGPATSSRAPGSPSCTPPASRGPRTCRAPGRWGWPVPAGR